MRIAVAPGGNALLQRGRPMTAAAQHTNMRIAARALTDLAEDHRIVVAHGNGPQVGLPAPHGAACDPRAPWPLDVPGAETEGMIGYLIEQELRNALPAGARCATLLSRVELDPADPAFDTQSKPIGPVRSAEEAEKAAREHDRTMTTGASRGLRRVVPSPPPLRILGLDAVRALPDAGPIVICAGGGGIPVMRKACGDMAGVEPAIDKERAAALLASDLGADALSLPMDVAAVFVDFGGPAQRPMDATTPDEVDGLDLPAGSMGPKVAAAAAFVRAGGALAGIGRLTDARAVLEGQAGARVLPDPAEASRPRGAGPCDGSGDRAGRAIRGMRLAPFRATLKNGDGVLVREVTKDDRARLEIGCEHLSPRSR